MVVAFVASSSSVLRSDNADWRYAHDVPEGWQCAWHELFGEITTPIRIEREHDADVDVVYRPTAPTRRQAIDRSERTPATR
jgi:hypothetical protein